MKVTMILSVDFDIGVTPPAEAFIDIEERLKDMMYRESGNGALSGASEMEVVSWDCTVRLESS